MSNLILHSLTEEELKKLIHEGLLKALEEYQVNKPAIEQNQIKDDLIRLSEAARLLKVSKVTIHAWKRKGLIPFYRISNKIYFKKSEILAALRKANNNNKLNLNACI
jgi:excisionase family DNA binding protein